MRGGLDMTQSVGHYDILSLVGTGLMITALTVGGLIQASAWEEGIPVYRGVIMVAPFMGLRAFSGLLIVLGQILLVYNIFKTLVFAEEALEGPLEEPSSLPASQLSAHVQS